MDDLQSAEESAFIAEEVERIVESSIETHLKDQAHDETKVARWIDSICETCMQDLADLGKPFKYVITCAIMQKNGAGLHTANSSYWDTVSDGCVTVKWPGDKSKEQNKTLYCIVSVYGLQF
ncbi:Dynein light chain Tctex-type [Hondaea fermentalgiana]|uniref:Dynein light chain Tctex-type n=1 Tax=Hondaea fermentalgiana TaxID=2315210 RepID=A0A2R5G4I6_9STRA|nr:Dynein light chain Tctex-type [Hondaea fermentalgiana]|eukprot:GBG24698.1 Dynein light chain Tctex-type [Hondaea fermentalgiana]